MTTSILHIYSSFIPIIPILSAGGLLLATFNKPDSGFRKASFWLFILAFVTVLFTCLVGGASMKVAESMPGTDISRLKNHAWTSMLAFIIALGLFYLNIYNRKRKRKIVDKVILSQVSIFIVLYIWTIFEAYAMR